MNKDTFYSLIQPYTMTSSERIQALYHALEYIKDNNIDGDLVECGVWKGGNILGMCEYLNYNNILNRKVWAYDTFKGMTPPEDVDIDKDNRFAKDIVHEPIFFCESPLEEVKNNVSKSSFPKENIEYIVGDVSETLDIEENLPKKISLLRLDTDWYKSTRKELEILYPRLSIGGILIVDDYGHWKGSRKAVDEYFANTNTVAKQIDYTGIIIQKDREINVK